MGKLQVWLDKVVYLRPTTNGIRWTQVLLICLFVISVVGLFVFIRVLCVALLDNVVFYVPLMTGGEKGLLVIGGGVFCIYLLFVKVFPFLIEVFSEGFGELDARRDKLVKRVRRK